MNDFDYDVYIKKRIARGYHSKKNGSKSKQCFLPSDRITEKQWKERNGSVMSYQLNTPMTWSMFKAMPKDLQTEYINNLRNKYGTTATDLSKFFGVTPATVTNHCKEALGLAFKPGQRMTKSQRTAFGEFLGETEAINGETNDEENLNIKQENVVDDKPAAEPDEQIELANKIESSAPIKATTKPARGSFGMKELTMSFSGNFDPDALRNSLLLSIGTGTPVKLEVVCQILC